MSLLPGEEYFIRQAVCTRDPKVLVETLDIIPSHRLDYAEIKDTIKDAGGSQYLKDDHIEMWDPDGGTTRIRERFGRVVVDHDDY